jgi:hypothetical protein
MVGVGLGCWACSGESAPQGDAADGGPGASEAGPSNVDPPNNARLDGGNSNGSLDGGPAPVVDAGADSSATADAGAAPDPCALPPTNGCTARWRLVRPTCTPTAGPFISFGPNGLTLSRTNSGGSIELELLDPPAGDFVSDMVVSSVATGPGPALKLGDVTDNALSPIVGTVVLNSDFFTSHKPTFTFQYAGGNYSYSASGAPPFPHAFSIGRTGAAVAARMGSGSGPSKLTHSGEAKVHIGTLYASGAFTGTVSSFSLASNGQTWTDTFACNSIAP